METIALAILTVGIYAVSMWGITNGVKISVSSATTGAFVLSILTLFSVF